MCYHVKFGCSASNGVCINRREPPKLESAGAPSPWIWGVADPAEICPQMCYPVEFGRSRSHAMSRSAWKIWTLASHFSRSLKVIRTDTNQSATYGFLLTFHSNHGPISYCFEFQSKIANFSLHCVFNAPPEAVLLGFG